MSTQQNHIIDKVVLEMNMSSEKTAYFIKDTISSFLESELFPELEIILEKYDVKESVIRIDELSVDLKFEKWENSNLLKSEIREAFRKKLVRAIPSIQLLQNAETRLKKLSPEENREQVFLYFLENGRLPWYAKEEHIWEISREDIWKESLENEQFVEKLKKVLSMVSFSARRFVLQFPDEMFFTFLNKTAKNISSSDIVKLRKLSKQFSLPTQKLFHQWLLKLAVRKNEIKSEIYLKQLSQIISAEGKQSLKFIEAFKPVVVPALEKIYPHFLKEADWSTIYESKEKEMVREKTKDESDIAIGESKDAAESYWEKEDELFVGNAGLILLHPFLKSFFDELEFLDKKGRIINSKKELAVQALHFLATGSEDFFEGNLIFEKFVCGVPLKIPVPRESLLTKLVKEEAGLLLAETIKHWPALKNTSPGGLRQNFLQRDGKLIKNEKKYRLLVERKTQDILLERISWNISVVKLPWMENLIHVEW